MYVCNSHHLQCIKQWKAGWGYTCSLCSCWILLRIQLLSYFMESFAVVISKEVHQIKDPLSASRPFESADTGQFWTSTRSSVMHTSGGQTEWAFQHVYEACLSAKSLYPLGIRQERRFQELLAQLTNPAGCWTCMCPLLVCCWVGVWYYDNVWTFSHRCPEQLLKCCWCSQCYSKPQYCFPDDHDKRHFFAHGLSQMSAGNFECCAGAIDGILLWYSQTSLGRLYDYCREFFVAESTNLFSGVKH